MTGTVPRLTRRRLAQQEAGEEPTEDLRIPQVKRKPKVKAKAKAPARLVKTKPAKRSAAKTASGLAGAESRPVAAGGTSAPVKDKKRRRNVAEVTTAGSRVQFSVEQNENSQESEVVSPVSTPKVVKDHSDAPQAPFTPQQRQMHRSSAGHTPPPTRMLGARRPPEPVGLESELPCLFAEGGGFQKARSATYPCYPEDPPTPPPFVREGFSDSVTEDSSYYHHWLFSAPCAEEGSTPKSVTPVEDVPPDSLVSIRSGHSDDASPVDEQRCRTRSLEQAHCVRRSVGRTPPPARLSQESERGTGDSLDEMTLRQVQEDALDSQPGRSSTRRSVSQPRLDAHYQEGNDVPPIEKPFIAINHQVFEEPLWRLENLRRLCEAISLPINPSSENSKVEVVEALRRWHRDSKITHELPVQYDSWEVGARNFDRLPIWPSKVKSCFSMQFQPLPVEKQLLPCARLPHARKASSSSHLRWNPYVHQNIYILKDQERQDKRQRIADLFKATREDPQVDVFTNPTRVLEGHPRWEKAKQNAVRNELLLRALYEESCKKKVDLMWGLRDSLGFATPRQCHATDT